MQKHLTRLFLLTQLLFLFECSIGTVHGTETSSFSRKEIRKARPVFLQMGIGSGVFNFRDFATSPLVYSGSPGLIAVSRLKYDSLRTSDIGIRYAHGSYTNYAGTTFSESDVHVIQFHFTRMEQIPKWCGSKWNVQAGGAFFSNINSRVNWDFGNNAYGSESFFSLCASGKITRNISRTEVKSKKLIFIKYNLKPRRREISGLFNIGLINSSYRNGFSYIGQSEIINNPIYNDGYHFRLLSGMRFSSEIDHTIFLKNKNAIQLSYKWLAYNSKRSFETFEFASHQLQFSFLFNTK